MDVTQTRYHNLPPKATVHRLLEMQFRLLQVPQTVSEDTDQEEQPSITLTDRHDTHKCMAYYRTVDGILSQQT